MRDDLARSPTVRPTRHTALGGEQRCCDETLIGGDEVLEQLLFFHSLLLTRNDSAPATHPPSAQWASIRLVVRSVRPRLRREQMRQRAGNLEIEAVHQQASQQ